jgi:hypothetical protein
MFYIVSDKDVLPNVLHKGRMVWQWFYDSSNTAWKTKNGAERALEKLVKKYPEEFANCYVGNPFTSD